MSQPFKCFLAAFGGVACAVALFFGYAFSQAHGDDHPPVPAPPPVVSSPTPPSIHVDDNWGGWRAHVGVSAGIGALTYALLPDAPWYAQLPLCLLPGHIRENRSRHQPGNRYSERDMVSNLAGCAAGLSLTHQVKLRIAPNWVGLSIALP